MFISYSSTDGKDFAEEMHQTLNGNGHDAYLIDHDAIDGANLWDEIANECLTRNRVIFIITESSIDSKGQKKEYDLCDSFYVDMTATIGKKCKPDSVFSAFPHLKPFLADFFDETNPVPTFEALAADLVRMQDRKGAITKGRLREDTLPKLSTDDLDEAEIEKCLMNLRASYESSSIVPEIGKTRIHDSTSKSTFMTVGFCHRLPLEWFTIEREPISNDFLFQEIGRDIALGERTLLCKKIGETEGVTNTKFSYEGILEAVNNVQKEGYKADIIFPTIECFLVAHHWGGKSSIKYSRDVSRPHIEAHLAIDGKDLEVLSPLGNTPRISSIMSSDAITWHVQKTQPQGALSATLGRDRLFPSRYVELIAMVRMNVEVGAAGFCLLNT